uniref:Uncharacterized protein n=1 Tax=Ditylenchus dipsaci TaxID=166011 RepID=A0A915DZI3_9BILA
MLKSLQHETGFSSRPEAFFVKIFRFTLGANDKLVFLNHIRLTIAKFVLLTFYEGIPTLNLCNFTSSSPATLNSENKSTKKFLNPNNELYYVNEFGQILSLMTNNSYYDGDAVASADGKWILFTSMATGDLELWVFELDNRRPLLGFYSSNEKIAVLGVKQLTSDMNYVSNAAFSFDSQKIIFSASRPSFLEENKNYETIIKSNHVDLNQTTELFVMELVDGQWSQPYQLTNLKGRSNTPVFMANNYQIMFSFSKLKSGLDKADLFSMDYDGKNIKQVLIGKNSD